MISLLSLMKTIPSDYGVSLLLELVSRMESYPSLIEMTGTDTIIKVLPLDLLAHTPLCGIECPIFLGRKV